MRNIITRITKETEAYFNCNIDNLTLSIANPYEVFLVIRQVLLDRYKDDDYIWTVYNHGYGPTFFVLTGEVETLIIILLVRNNKVRVLFNNFYN